MTHEIEEKPFTDFRYPTTSAGSRSTVEDLILDRFDNILGTHVITTCTQDT